MGFSESPCGFLIMAGSIRVIFIRNSRRDLPQRTQRAQRDVKKKRKKEKD
jgi:hypothetical protein